MATQTSFPLQYFPPDLQHQIRRVAEYESVPETLPALGALAGASMAIGRGFDYAIDQQATPIPSNLWITPVAPPSTGKSSLNKFLDVLKDIYKEQTKEWRSELKPVLLAENERIESELFEARKNKDWEQVKELKKQSTELQMRLRAGRPAWKVENFTVESLTSAFACEGRTPYVCIIATEGRAVADNLCCSYGDKSTESFWLAGWSRVDSVMRTRKGFEDSDADGEIEGLQVSAIFCLQPDKHEPFLKPPFSTSGFAQRRLFCLVEPGEFICPIAAKEKAEKLGIPRPNMENWNRWVREMMKQAFVMQGHRCIPNTEAGKIWNDWYIQINEAIQANRLSGLEGHARRWGEICAKLSLILHCLKHGKGSDRIAIDADSMTGAVEITKWFASEMKAGYWEVETQVKADMFGKFQKFAGSRGGFGFTLRDLSRGGVGTRQEIKTLVESLEKRGGVIRVMQPVTAGAGRPKADRWILREYSDQERQAA